MLSRTPNNISIIKRIRSIAFPEGYFSWFPTEPGTEIFIDTLSCYFLEGEKFVMESVKYFKNKIKDKKLLNEINCYIAQESMHFKNHSDEHLILREKNIFSQFSMLTAKFMLNLCRKATSHRYQLAVTCAIEHITACISGAAIEQYQHLNHHLKMPQKQLWLWHAVEEIEHKGVAMDVYNSCVKNTRWAYFLRANAMIVTSFVYITIIAINFPLMYFWDKFIKRPFSSSQKNCRFSWNKNGFYTLRKGVKRFFCLYLNYYKPSFHPWQHDNSSLLLSVIKDLNRNMGSDPK